jgi:hypothetical protein
MQFSEGDDVELNHSEDPWRSAPPVTEAGSTANSRAHLKGGKVAVEGAPPTQVAADTYGYDAEDERGYGWVVFAGTLLLMLGTLNFIEGLAAINERALFSWPTPTTSPAA